MPHLNRYHNWKAVQPLAWQIIPPAQEATGHSRVAASPAPRCWTFVVNCPFMIETASSQISWSPPLFSMSVVTLFVVFFFFKGRGAFTPFIICFVDSERNHASTKLHNTSCKKYNSWLVHAIDTAVLQCITYNLLCTLLLSQLLLIKNEYESHF